MTYQIEYTSKGDKVHCIFDIEYYMNHMNNDANWFSELNPLPITDGIIHYLKDKRLEEGFDYEQFAADCEQIAELRRKLYEVYDNKPKQYNDASAFHYKVFGNDLKDTLEAFAKKYGFSVNED